MKANSTHISYDTNKLLRDCGCNIDSRHWFLCVDNSYIDHPHGVVFTELTKYDKAVDWARTNCKDSCRAYTWMDILWEHAEEFFGYGKIDTELLYCHRTWTAWQYGTMTELDFESEIVPAYEFYTTNIKNFLQQKKYEEADLYFREHCILIKNQEV